MKLITFFAFGTVLALARYKCRRPAADDTAPEPPPFFGRRTMD
jgi:hypothetical protein